MVLDRSTRSWPLARIACRRCSVLYYTRRDAHHGYPELPIQEIDIS